MRRTTIALLLALAALPLGAALIGVLAAPSGTVTIQPGQQGVVSRDGDIVSVLGPGPHSFNSRTDEVAVYNTLVDRSYTLPFPLLISDCLATVTLVYGVRDVAALHLASGTEQAAVIQFSDTIRRLAAGFREITDDPRAGMQAHLRAGMADQVIYGYGARWIGLDLNGCAPTAP